MILAIDRATYISIQHAQFKPHLSVQHIGEIRKLSGVRVWQMNFTGRNWESYSDLLNSTEKAQIIRLLAKLNGENSVVLADPGSLRRRWNQVIGTWVGPNVVDSDNGKER